MPKCAPSDALISGQMPLGSTFSPSGTQNCEPPHSPVTAPPQATTTSSGTNTQNVPNTLPPCFCSSMSSAGRTPWISDTTKS